MLLRGSPTGSSGEVSVQALKGEMRMSITDQVDAISSHYDWTEIYGAYGRALWMPETLQALAADNETRQIVACERILELMNHQGTHYEGTGPALDCVIQVACVAEG